MSNTKTRKQKQQLVVNVSDSINSGQVFLWKKRGDVWFGVNGENDILEVKDDMSDSSSSWTKAQYKFFRLDDNQRYKKILRDISKDDTVKQSVKRYPGLRILRQDPFQCYISFIVSSNSNIPNIRRGLEKICCTFGKKVGARNQNGVYSHLFPSPRKLANASVAELQSCGLGYRAKFVKEASKRVTEKQIDLEELKNDHTYDTARQQLLQVPGIGSKVADCIMLFALEKLEAFPLDTWMLKVLQEFYKEKFFATPVQKEIKTLTEKRYDTLHKQIVDYFGCYAGVSQQFLFKMIRDQNQKKWL